MKNFLLATAIFSVSLISSQVFAQQTKTTTKATTTSATEQKERSGQTTSNAANNSSTAPKQQLSKPTPKPAAPKQNVQKTPEQRVDMRIARIDKKVGKLTDDQKAKLKPLLLDEISQMSSIKPTKDPKAENPFVAIRKKTETEVKALLTPEQLALYTKPMQTATKGKTGTTKPMPSTQKPVEHSHGTIEHHSEEKLNPTKSKLSKNSAPKSKEN